MWYYEVAGFPQGPIERKRLEAMLQTGSLRPNALIWSNGMPNWGEAGRYLREAEEPSPPAHRRKSPPPPYGRTPARNLPQSIRFCLSHYARFTGRASRSEFWNFAAFVALIGLVLAPIPLLSACALLVLWVPLSAAASRRLQDAGYSGWWHSAPLLIALALAFSTAPLALLSQDLAATALILAALGYSAALLGLVVPLTRRPQSRKNRYG